MDVIQVSSLYSKKALNQENSVMKHFNVSKHMNDKVFFKIQYIEKQMLTTQCML